MSEPEQTALETSQTPPKKLPKEPSEQLIRQFFDNQAKELDVKQQQVALQFKELDVDASTSSEAIKAQIEDRKGERNHTEKMVLGYLRFSAFIILLVFALCGYALYIGKEHIVIEGLKAVVFIAAGAIGGFFTGKNKAQKDLSDQIDKALEE